MTHEDLVKKAARWLRNSRRCKFVLTELRAAHPVECADSIGWRAKGWSILVECKTSRADLISDTHKPFRTDGRGLGAERYYLTLPGLIRHEELVFGWGLLELRGNRVWKVGLASKDDSRSKESMRREVGLLAALLHRTAAKIHPRTLDEWIGKK